MSDATRAAAVCAISRLSRKKKNNKKPEIIFFKRGTLISELITMRQRARGVSAFSTYQVFEVTKKIKKKQVSKRARPSSETSAKSSARGGKKRNSLEKKKEVPPSRDDSVSTRRANTHPASRTNQTVPSRVFSVSVALFVISVVFFSPV